MTGHSQRAHAILSASAADRWMNCTPSARITEQIPQKSSTFADEGTLAHEIAELHLHKYLKNITANEFKKQLAVKMEHNLYYDGMIEDLMPYVEFIQGEIASLRRGKKDPEVFIEKKLDLREWAPESFGTVDLLIVYDDTIKIRDLKFGKGLAVSAIDNSQLKVYALGALSLFELERDIKTIDVGIIQPRLKNNSTWSISADDLRYWGENVMRPLARIAYEGDGQQVSGPWCKFCPAKPTCQKIAADNLRLARMEFKPPTQLRPDQIADVLGRVDVLVDWVKSVKEHALVQALQGTKYPGYKVVEGKSQRQITNEADAIENLREADYTDEQIFNLKLKGIGELEKLVGKKNFKELLGEYVIKPQGAPTLAPTSDPRMEYSTAESDFSQPEAAPEKPAEQAAPAPDTSAEDLM